jgi:large repetitive protein
MKRTTRLLSIAFIALLFPFFLSAQNDLSVGVTVNIDTANIGASRTFTVTVYNQGATTVTGVHLSTVLTSGLTFVSATPSVGTYAANNWDIGTISAATPSVTMTIVATASAESVQTLTAQIAAMVETDGDSAPNNNDLKEDDIKIACLSVPVYYCDGATINMTATATAGMTYQWFKDGVLIAGQTAQTYIITAIGSYTYTATGGSIAACTGNSCCPIIVRYVPTPDLATTPVSICNGSSTDLLARVTDNNATTGTLAYYTSMADATAQTGAITSTVSPTTTTTYYIRKNVTTNGYLCFDIESVTVTVHAVPDLTLAPVSICNGSSTDLAATVTDNNSTTGTLAYYLSMAAATAQTGAISSTVSPTTTTTYYIRKNTTTTPSCFDIESVVVTVHAVPDLTLAPVSICIGSSTDLAATVTDNNSTTGTLAYYLSMAAATAQTGAISSTVSPTTTTTYYIRKNTTTTPSCNDIESVVVTVNSVVTAGTATNPANICQAGSGIANVDLAAQIASETTGGTWSQPSGTAVGSALNTTTGVLNVNGLAVGVYVFRYSVTATAPCSPDTEDVTVTIEACCPATICLPVTVVRN